MTLARLIRKSEVVTVATAIPAISATDGHEGGAIVARIATVAVASPTDEETAVATPPEVKTANPDPLDSGEIFHYGPEHEPTKPSKGVDRVASAGEPPKPVLSPSGLWYFIPPMGSPKYHGEPTATRGEPRKPADMEVEF